MLIKLTNQCTMGCPHCMEDAQEHGSMMTLGTFKNAVRFGNYLGCAMFMLSGGEPTENSHIEEMCNWFDANTERCMFNILSNGMWLKDEAKRQRVERITKLRSFMGMQVYTHRRWYKEYDYVVSHKPEYEQYNGVLVDIDSPIRMHGVGRARRNAEAMEEAEKNSHFMSCINSVLAAVQVRCPNSVCTLLEKNLRFCTPSVDCEGTVCMSESSLCPSVGNVNTDDFEQIWKRMKDFRPCGHCVGYRRFIQSEREDIKKAKTLLRIDDLY